MSDYDNRIKHGLAKKHPLYGRWVGMRQRCNDPNHARYADYGGKGIKVCARWDSFTAFLEDMGDCPKGMSIERKDNSLGYSPDNCVWAPVSAQVRNRSMTVWLELDGEKRCLQDWATKLGISFATLKERLQRWDYRTALTTPKLPNNGARKPI